jgi:hypothetical protein
MLNRNREKLKVVIHLSGVKSIHRAWNEMLQHGAYLILPAPSQCAGATRKGIKRKMTHVYIAALRILQDIYRTHSLGFYQITFLQRIRQYKLRERSEMQENNLFLAGTSAVLFLAVL